MGLAKALRLGCLTASASHPASKFGLDYYEKIGWGSAGDFDMRIASATVPHHSLTIKVV
jgi:hypothetical protein